MCRRSGVPTTDPACACSRRVCGRFPPYHGIATAACCCCAVCRARVCVISSLYIVGVGFGVWLLPYFHRLSLFILARLLLYTHTPQQQQHAPPRIIIELYIFAYSEYHIRRVCISVRCVVSCLAVYQ